MVEKTKVASVLVVSGKLSKRGSGVRVVVEKRESQCERERRRPCVQGKATGKSNQAGRQASRQAGPATLVQETRGGGRAGRLMPGWLAGVRAGGR